MSTSDTNFDSMRCWICMKEIDDYVCFFHMKMNILAKILEYLKIL